jgi:integrase
MLAPVARESRAGRRFPLSEGGVASCTDLRGQVRGWRMLDELGIKRVRLHDARHSCATLMHLRQVPIAVIAAWLGHANAAFTMSV